MMQIAFGILVLLAPFVTVLVARSPRFTFQAVALLALVWHCSTAFVLQLMGLFSYPAALLLALLFAGLLLYRSYAVQGLAARGRLTEALRTNLRGRMLLLVAIALVVFQSWSVHFWYAGGVATSGGTVTVEREPYPYPYFSDEWVGAALAKRSIETGGTAFVNPYQGNPYPQLMAPYYAGLSNIFVVSGIDPVSGFGYLPIASSLIVSLLGYALARSLKARTEHAVIAMLLLSFITNSSNLPGLWYVIPVTAGIAALLIAASWRIEKRRSSIYASFAAVAVYPPLAPLALPFIIGARKWNKKTLMLLAVLAVSIGAVIVGAAASASGQGLAAVLRRYIGYIVRPSGLGNSVVISYPPYAVMSFLAIIFFLIAVPYLWRTSRAYVAVIGIGAAFWIFYSLYPDVFIIDSQRVVFITAVFITIASACGMTVLADVLERKGFSTHLSVRICAGVVGVFILMSPWYTTRSQWQNLLARVTVRDRVSYAVPAPPANRYLHPDDLAAFAPYNKETFVAQPWKGLVIGTVTNNRPLETKASVVGVARVRYSAFMDASCDEKASLLTGVKARLAYTTPFECPGFRAVASSSEGFVLYEFDVIE